MHSSRYVDHHFATTAYDSGAPVCQKLVFGCVNTSLCSASGTSSAPINWTMIGTIGGGHCVSALSRSDFGSAAVLGLIVIGGLIFYYMKNRNSGGSSTRKQPVCCVRLQPCSFAFVLLRRWCRRQQEMRRIWPRAMRMCRVPLRLLDQLLRHLSGLLRALCKCRRFRPCLPSGHPCEPCQSRLERFMVSFAARLPGPRRLGKNSGTQTTTVSSPLRPSYSIQLFVTVSALLLQFCDGRIPLDCACRILRMGEPARACKRMNHAYCRRSGQLLVGRCVRVFCKFGRACCLRVFLFENCCKRSASFAFIILSIICNAALENFSFTNRSWCARAGRRGVLAR